LINLVALFPNHLDLNGDQANLKVAKKRLEWLGYEVKISAIDKGQLIPLDADFIFLGHGSMAAWADLEDELERIAPQLEEFIARGTAFMAVASGYERAIAQGLFDGSLESTERVSKFEVVDLDGTEVLGYLNVSSKAPYIQRQGLTLGTQLHGPIFSKNPKLVDEYFADIVAAKGESVSPAPKSSSKNIELISQIVDSVWKLERDLASE
jgi:CobQ-like glutamine amidotransferase family enzyme